MENCKAVSRPDPEVQAGRALRRLRLSHRWSQEEVARRMQAYGYDFHQTMIAKIEAAQRPLRVRELADFAALYGVGVPELIYPPSGSAAEIDREIAEVTAEQEAIRQDTQQAAYALDAAQVALVAAQDRYRALDSQVAVLKGRLAFLQEERKKFALWEMDEEPTPSERSAGNHSDRAASSRDVLADLDRAIELDPSSASAFANRASIYREMKRYDEALASFDRAIELDPSSASAFANRALAYREMKRYDEALADLDRAIELNPSYTWALVGRARIYQYMKRYDEALADFDRAIELNPSSALAITGRGLLYRARGRHEDAQADFDRAIELDPRMNGVINA